MTTPAINAGYSLVELLLGLVVSLIVLSSAVALFSVNSNAGALHLQRDFLRSQLLMVADNMKNDIARAGFCYDCPTTNPFLTPDASGRRSAILIDDSATKTTDGSCIRFAYNLNKRPGTVVLDKDDAMGFRLGEDPNGNPVIEQYENWKELTNWRCDSGYWRDITVERIHIESLRFKRSHYPAVRGTNTLQFVEVEIGATLQANREVSGSVAFSIALPNIDG